MGQSVSFTAAVTSTTASAPNAAGAVSFYDGVTLLATIQVNAAGQATFATAALGAGLHTIVATYNGSADYGTGSASANIVVAQTSSATKLTPVSNTLTLGQTAQLTATVTGVNPTGTVVFAFSGANLCTSALNAGGVATCGFTPTAAGSLSVTARYQGDANNLPSSGHIALSVTGSADSAISLTFASTTWSTLALRM